MTTQNKKKPIEEDQQSEWSLSSLEELKGLNLNDLKDEEDGMDVPKQSHGHTEPKNKPQVRYPPTQEINADTKLHEVGKIVQKVGQVLIIEAMSAVDLVDLDNWIFDEKKQCIGFVIDIFGRVDHPFYAVKLSEKMQKQAIDWASTAGIVVFYAEGCKTLTEQDIRSIKQKSSVNKEAEQDSDSSSQQNNEEDLRSNVMMRRRDRSPRRRASFEEPPYHQRERTREKKPSRRFEVQNHRRRHHDPRPPFEINRDRQHNQAYLENMYNSYYAQMMQLYNGQNGMPLPKPPVFPFFQQPQMASNQGFPQMNPQFMSNMEFPQQFPPYYPQPPHPPQ